MDILEGKITFCDHHRYRGCCCCLPIVSLPKSSLWFRFGLAFVLGGAIGNFIDRLQHGFVVDMFQLDFINFPIFNIADMSLVFGVILIFIYALVDDEAKGNKENQMEKQIEVIIKKKKGGRQSVG